MKIDYSRGAVSGDAKRGPGPRQYRGNRASLPGTMARPADSNVVAADGGSSGGGDGGGSQWKRGLTALLAHHPATSATQPSVTVRISRALDAIMLVFLSSKPITCRPPPLASAAAVPPPAPAPAPACTCAAACAGTGGREEEGPSSVSRQHAAASPTPALSPAARPHRTAPLCIASHRIASAPASRARAQGQLHLISQARSTAAGAGSVHGLDGAAGTALAGSRGSLASSSVTQGCEVRSMVRRS